MEMERFAANGKMLNGLAETGGAIGIICGLLLLGMFFFLRNLLHSLQERDKEMFSLNRELHKALVNNTAAMTALGQILQHRRCLADETRIVERINQATKPQYANDL